MRRFEEKLGSINPADGIQEDGWFLQATVVGASSKLAEPPKLAPKDSGALKQCRA
jgi:hypothetical protein